MGTENQISPPHIRRIRRRELIKLIISPFGHFGGETKSHIIIIIIIIIVLATDG
jgi:hypothetical protein